ncbi:MAG: response regulator transcription factor [Proteobacteria bacterium]|nr:response regulator transcription factor [Pseudomonadota bacterium]
MVERIRVVIADDHPLFRDGLRRTLSDFVGCEVVAACANADEALDAVCEHLPDIVLLDIRMPGGGIEAARQIAAACPKVRILMLTTSERESDVRDSLEAGARGYILKGMGGEEMATVIKSVHEGELYVPPGLAARMLIDNKDHKGSQRFDLFSLLTKREEQVLKQVAQGLNNKEIALDLSLSENTVKRYMTNILRKLQVRNRVEAALKVYDRYAAL